MKLSSLSFALVAAMTLSVGCAKKAAVPGTAPTANENTPSTPGVQPTGGSEKIVEKENEAGKKPQSTSLALDGGWESNCVKTRYHTTSETKEVNQYDSYRYYITISNGALYEQLFYFKGETCASYDLSIESGQGDLWFFNINQEGVANGAPFQIDYTELNFEATYGIYGVIALKEEAGKKSIVFDDSTLVFTQQN